MKRGIVIHGAVRINEITDCGLALAAAGHVRTSRGIYQIWHIMTSGALLTGVEFRDRRVSPFAFSGACAAQQPRSRAVQLGCDRAVATPKYVIVEE